MCGNMEETNFKAKSVLEVSNIEYWLQLICTFLILFKTNDFVCTIPSSPH